MTDINALIFALAFTMAFMLLIGAYTRIELKKNLCTFIERVCSKLFTSLHSPPL